MGKLILFLKAILMGAADIIPGVSGGSIALITGIYDDLIDAIHSVDKRVVKDILKFRLLDGIKRIHWHILLPIGLGILTAVFTMAKLMNYLIEEYTLYTWSLFFGLILSSAYVISKQYKLTSIRILNILIGGIFSFVVVGLVPVNTPNTLWFLFLSGVIGICAMILPGISGAFLLLILGKYHYITEIIKNPFSAEHILIITVFALGCLVGIISFSRLLKRILNRWHSPTMAFLTGMMLGSLRKIWPYKEIVESKLINGELFIIKERLISPLQIEGNYLASFGFILLGILLVIILDKTTNIKTR